MNVHIAVHINTRDGRFMRAGTFPVLASDFKKDPDNATAIVAYEWIRKIRMEHGFNIQEYEVEKVIYNGEHDITEIVKQIRPVIKDDLPF